MRDTKTENKIREAEIKRLEAIVQGQGYLIQNLTNKLKSKSKFPIFFVGIGGDTDHPIETLQINSKKELKGFLKFLNKKNSVYDEGSLNLIFSTSSTTDLIKSIETKKWGCKKYKFFKEGGKALRYVENIYNDLFRE